MIYDTPFVSNTGKFMYWKFNKDSLKYCLYEIIGIRHDQMLILRKIG